jgi:acid phosphatase
VTAGAALFATAATVAGTPTDSGPTALTAATSAATVPRFSHVVVVTEENQDFGRLADQAPYLTSLAAKGALFTNSHGVVHPSEGNYVALYSGDTNGLTDDSCGARVSKPNIYTQLAGSVTNYSESKPADPCGTSGGRYSPWHNAATYFANVPASASQDLARFPTDFARLPKVSYVAPNMDDDMHDGSVAAGDAWLKRHLGSYASWATTHNSLLVVTTDEDSGTDANHIYTLFSGAGIKPGTYGESINHYSVLRTIEAAFGRPGLGRAATTAPITNVFDSTAKKPIPSTAASTTQARATTAPTTAARPTTAPTSSTPARSTTPQKAPPHSSTTKAPASGNFRLAGQDAFSGTSVDTAKWSVYDDRPACTVSNGVLHVAGNSSGLCGMAWQHDQTYGKWEVRARYPAPADGGFDATMLLWPSDDSAWRNAEIDYVEETDPARQSLDSFVHCTACSGGQIDHTHNVDMTRWHTYAVEWTPHRITGLIDGTPWFTVTDPAAISTIPHHATIQQDGSRSTRSSGNPDVQVDWFKVYSYNAR